MEQKHFISGPAYVFVMAFAIGLLLMSTGVFADTLVIGGYQGGLPVAYPFGFARPAGSTSSDVYQTLRSTYDATGFTASMVIQLDGDTAQGWKLKVFGPQNTLASSTALSCYGSVLAERSYTSPHTAPPGNVQYDYPVFDFATTTIQGGKYYKFCMVPSAPVVAGSDVYYWGGLDIGQYLLGSSGADGPGTTAGAGADLYLSLTGDSFTSFSTSTYQAGNLQIRFPEDGMTTPDFASWFISASGLNPTQKYYVKVVSVLTSSTATTTDLGVQHVDWVSFVPGTANVTGLPIPKLYGLTAQPLPAAGTNTWSVSATLCGESQCFIPLSYDQLTFYASFSSTVPNTPYTALNDFDVPNDYYYDKYGNKLIGDQVDAFRSFNCAVSTTNLGDQLYGFGCNFIRVSIIPSKSSTDFLWSAIKGYNGIYPFKYVFDLADAARTQSAAGSTTTPELVLDYSSIPGWFGARFSLLSSSTLSGVIGDHWTDEFKRIERYIIWLGVAAVVVITLLPLAV